MVYKKLSLLFVLVIIAMTSSFAHENATFFSQTPIYDLNTTTNIVTVDYDVDTAGPNLITATSELILQGTPQGDIIIDTETTSGLGGRDAVQHNFNLNYNGDYIVRVTVENEDDISQNEINTDISFSVTGLIDYPSGGNDVSQLSELFVSVFIVMETIVAGIAALVVGDLLILAVVTAFVAMFVGIAFVISRFVTNSTNTSLKNK